MSIATARGQRPDQEPCQLEPQQLRAIPMAQLLPIAPSMPELTPGIDLATRIGWAKPSLASPMPKAFTSE